MSATYFFALTDYGSSIVAQAHNQRNIELFNLVLGDANGQPYNPMDRKSFDSLVNQRASVPIQSVTAVGNICRVISTIDSSVGGFNIHELGLTDSTGELVYVGNYHGGYKPELENGAFGELELIIDIKAEAGSDVLIEVSPNSVTANKQWVIDNFVLQTAFNTHVQQNADEHLALQNQITELQNTYPKIIASGVAIGSNNFEIDLSAFDKIKDLRDNKYAIHLTPENDHEAWNFKRLAHAIQVNMWDRSGTNRIAYSGNVSWSVIQTQAESASGGNGDYYAGTYNIAILPNETKRIYLVGGGGGGGIGVHWDDKDVVGINGENGESSQLFLNDVLLAQAGGGGGGERGYWDNGSAWLKGEAGNGGSNSFNQTLNQVIFIAELPGQNGTSERFNHVGGTSVHIDHAQAGNNAPNYGAGGNGGNGYGNEDDGWAGGAGSAGYVEVSYKNTSPETEFLTLIVGKGGKRGQLPPTYTVEGTNGIDGFAKVSTVYIENPV